MLYRANVPRVCFVSFVSAWLNRCAVTGRSRLARTASTLRCPRVALAFYQGSLVHGPVSREPQRRLVLHAAVFSRSSADSFFPTRRSLLEEEVDDHCFSATTTLR